MFIVPLRHKILNFASLMHRRASIIAAPVVFLYHTRIDLLR